MKSEQVDLLYEKFGKTVPQGKRKNFKKALAESDNEKFENLQAYKLECKKTVFGFNSIIGLFATIFGMCFLILNIVALNFLKPDFLPLKKQIIEHLKALRLIVIVYDIIMIAVAACYFIYFVISGFNRAKERNYEEIMSILS